MKKNELPLNILVVDNNKVYASKVKDFLQSICECEVDIANNIWILKRRLLNKNYNVVLADLSISMQSDEIDEILVNSQIPIIKWSMRYKNESLRDSFVVKNEEIKKPDNLQELKNIISCFVFA